MNWNVGDQVRYRGVWLPIGGSHLGTVKEVKANKLFKVDFQIGNDTKSFLIDGTLLAKENA